MDKFSELVVFVKIVECGGFSKAGEILNLSKSAVSKRISGLEEKLNVKLIQRNAHGLCLTEAGSIYYQHAKKALAIVLHGEETVIQMQNYPQGTLRVNVPLAFGRIHISPIIPAFLALYPGLKIEMQMDDKLADLVSEGFDLTFRVGNLPDSALYARRIASCKSVVCASPRYFSVFGKPSHPTELYHHNCLFYANQPTGMEWTFCKGNEQIKVQPQGNYRANSSDAIYEALLQGGGVCQMPTFIVGDALKRGELVTVLDEYALPEHAIYVVFPEKKYMPRKVGVFIDYLQTYFATSSFLSAEVPTGSK
ncbi:LysR family transcriptional regulator [Obesumbacterium proteus]|uniref:LysR family transcriptional regulator n=1 Tax=Obesumbacterium proteus TaxID=82983 RepID=UPI00242C9824|nr:LysR family transcriptional regulator [Obesumbacterium proteus]